MSTDEIIEQTKQLMAIQSTADRPDELRRAVEFVADIVAQHQDITIERFERNGKLSFLAYRSGPRPKQFDILLNGHVDVVPGKSSMFKPYEKNGKLYGRGALDMKGTVLTLADVFCELVNEVPYNLGLQIVSDEEIGGYDGVRMHIDDYGVRAKFVVMGEYANDRHAIYNAARGLCWAEIAFKGKSAHGGHLWHGSNAVVKAGAFAGALLKRYPTPDKETWTTTASIADLTTPNDAFNKVPDKAVLKIDFRFTQEDPVFQNRDTLVAFIKDIDPDAELINTVTFEPAVHVEELNPYVQGMSRALEAVTGGKTKYLGRPASSDGRHFAMINNDIVEFGLYGKGSHSNKEYVELASFDEYRETMRQFLRKPIPEKLERVKAEPLQEQLLRRLVEYPTVTGDFLANNNAFGYVEQFLTERGMHVEHIDINGFRSIVATTRPGNKQPTVLLSAHMDVVPASNEMLRLTLKGGRFYGRGVMDTKHAIAAYMTMVDALKDELDTYDFGIMITSDEEIGSNNGTKRLTEMGYHAEVVIVPDGGNDWKLETFAKGVIWAKLEATGKAAHASRPWEGESAIQRLMGAIREIEELMPKNPSPQDTLMSIGTINGGITANQIPVHASAMLDIRPGSVEDHERITPAIEEICQRHDVMVTFPANEPPLVTDPKNPWVKPMVEIVEHVTSAQHDTSYDFGVSDGRIFNAAGIPTIVINPECGNIHREDEWLSRKGFTQFCQVIEAYVRRMAVKHPGLSQERSKDIANLAKRLNRRNEPVYVWYAAYGSGLSKANFIDQIRGIRQMGALIQLKGCRDKSAPIKDAFTYIPYRLYFSGESKIWGGGMGRIEPLPNPNAHTIARLYLITLEQFEDIYQGMGERGTLPKTALKTALQYGLATFGDGTKDFDALVFCGMRDGYPVLTLTAPQIRTPYTPPSAAYTQAICKGMSESSRFDNQGIQQLLDAPGMLNSDASKQIRESLDKSKKNK